MKDIRSYIGWGIYLLIGVILAALVIVTGTYGLAQTDRDIYQMAMDLDHSADGFGFAGFSPENYKIRISNGKTDYVMWNGECEKKPAAIDTLVATAQDLDGEYQVILPAYQDFSEFVRSVGTLASLSEGGESFSSENYSHESHAATLFHEAFHAWQFSNYENSITEYMAQSFQDGLLPENIIVDKVDADERNVQSLENELKYLYSACKAADREDAAYWLRLALDEESLRRGSLDEDALAAELYLETVEGTAKYVESMAYRELRGTGAWETEYLTETGFSGGSGKYYTIGMLKCLLLDKLSPEWKSGFSLPCDLGEYLAECL